MKREQCQSIPDAINTFTQITLKQQHQNIIQNIIKMIEQTNPQ